MHTSLPHWLCCCCCCCFHIHFSSTFGCHFNCVFSIFINTKVHGVSVWPFFFFEMHDLNSEFSEQKTKWHSKMKRESDKKFLNWLQLISVWKAIANGRHNAWKTQLLYARIKNFKIFGIRKVIPLCERRTLYEHGDLTLPRINTFVRLSVNVRHEYRAHKA